MADGVTRRPGDGGPGATRSGGRECGTRRPGATAALGDDAASGARGLEGGEGRERRGAPGSRPLAAPAGA